MAYDFGKFSIDLTAQGAGAVGSDGTLLTSVADVLTYAPGRYSFILRGVTVIVGVALTAADPATLTIDKRPTMGSDTSRAVICAMTVPAAQAIGTGVYTAGLSTTFAAGAELVVGVTGASTAGRVRVIIDGEWVYDTPGNNSNLTSVSA